jgi:hypothetical protein
MFSHTTYVLALCVMTCSLPGMTANTGTSINPHLVGLSQHLVLLLMVTDQVSNSDPAACRLRARFQSAMAGGPGKGSGEKNLHFKLVRHW